MTSGGRSDLAYSLNVELIGTGRMAEVFAVDDDTVVKLDRPEHNGATRHEATLLVELALAGLPLSLIHI